MKFKNLTLVWMNIYRDKLADGVNEHNNTYKTCITKYWCKVKHRHWFWGKKKKIKDPSFEAGDYVKISEI